MKNTAPTILIIGGGAGGLELAVLLGNTVGKKKAACIKLVDKSLTHIWKPLLHEVAAGTLGFSEDQLDYFSLAQENGFVFEPGEFIHLDRKGKKVVLKPALLTEEEKPRELHYDTLVLAIGSITNDFHTPGAKEHCYFLDDQVEAEKLHAHYLDFFIKAQYKEDEKLNVAIVGGGATGVELAAELHYAASQMQDYGLENLSQKNKVQISIVEAGPRLLSGLSDAISFKIQRELAQQGIKIYVNEKVAKVTSQGLFTHNHLFLPSQLKIWTAGVTTFDLAKHLDGLETNKANQVLVESTLQTLADTNIFALGDCAACPVKPGAREFCPPRAQVAHQQAFFLAKSLKHLLANKKLDLFYYHNFGSLVTLSKYTTIGQLQGVKRPLFNFQGKIARWMYYFLYKRHQATVIGWWRTFILTIARRLAGLSRPRLKLH